MDYNAEVDIFRFQLISIAVSIFFIAFIVFLIRARKLREDYSLLWLFFGAIFLVFSIWREGLDYIAQMAGVAYPPAMLFIVLIMCLFMIVIQFSVIISKQSNQIIRLTQDIALLRSQIQENESKKDN